MNRLLPATVAATVCAVALLSAAPKFTSAWRSPEAGTVSFAGKKVAALVIAQDDSLRMSGEEALARELTARGLQSVATYRIAPKEELQSADRAKVWFEKANVEGVVAMRPVSNEKRTTYNPGMWTNPYYSSFWGYYGYGWGNMYIPGSGRSRHRRGRRDDDLQRAAESAALGGRERDQESEGPAAVRRRPREGIREGAPEAGTGPELPK